MGNALNIEYYFLRRDDLLIHHDAPFHFMVNISIPFMIYNEVFDSFCHPSGCAHASGSYRYVVRSVVRSLGHVA